MQRSNGCVDGNAAGTGRHALVIAGLLGSAALLVACTSGEDLVTTAVPPSAHPYDAIHGQGALLPVDADLQSAKFTVTPTQRGFLDALVAAGVHPSSELEALSIGSHVCQAHAAGQSDQAVWDYIAPMVRSDVVDAGSPPLPGPDPRVTEATADYIRIATQRLC